MNAHRYTGEANAWGLTRRGREVEHAMRVPDEGVKQGARGNKHTQARGGDF
jgi:hypothetical protein